jgi:ABC-type Fe3+/spermidine/putrescine transport system ATPase subunit
MNENNSNLFKENSPFVLEVNDLVKAFNRGSVIAVDNVSFSMNQGEILAILGPSGCGKTTMMRLIAGLEYPDSGDIIVNGNSVLGLPAHRRNIGLVFQDLAVFPHKSIFENVAFGLRLQKLNREEIVRRVNKTLEMVELPPETFSDRYPQTLSGGQKQRVAVARTLAVRPSIVLLDEPMASLDRKLRDRMTVELRLILKRLSITVLYVTHDQESASFFADRIILMEAGRIIQSGTPIDIYKNPKSQFVADFIGTMNFIPARVSDVGPSGVTAEFIGEKIVMDIAEVKIGDRIVFAVRPEELKLSKTQTDRSLIQGKLLTWNFYGGAFHYRVILKDGTELLAIGSLGGFTKAVDTGVWVECDPKSLLVLKE